VIYVADAQVHAVVVTYLPQLRPLADLLVALAPQVVRILVIDNTPAADRRVLSLIDSLERPEIELIRLGANFGIGKALNVGIERATHAGATHVLLSDQDSLPKPNLVAGLMRAWYELADRGLQVGAVGPTFTDIHTGITYPFQARIAGRFLYGHIRTSVERPLVETLTLITSGALIPVTAFQTVGLMREDFFIDHVDIEWCHRARAAGLSLFGTSYAEMFHSMGDSYLRVWFFGWRRESAYNPVRMYYRIRNFIVLCKASYIPVSWKMRNAWHWLGFIYSHIVFGSEKRRSLNMVLRGIWDGVRGKMGPLAP
jgi:rhamnosyltransferase